MLSQSDILKLVVDTGHAPKDFFRGRTQSAIRVRRALFHVLHDLGYDRDTISGATGFHEETIKEHLQKKPHELVYAVLLKAALDNMGIKEIVGKLPDNAYIVAVENMRHMLYVLKMSNNQCLTDMDLVRLEEKGKLVLDILLGKAYGDFIPPLH